MGLSVGALLVGSVSGSLLFCVYQQPLTCLLADRKFTNNDVTLTFPYLFDYIIYKVYALFKDMAMEALETPPQKAALAFHA